MPLSRNGDIRSSKTQGYVLYTKASPGSQFLVATVFCSHCVRYLGLRISNILAEEANKVLACIMQGTEKEQLSGDGNMVVLRLQTWKLLFSVPSYSQFRNTTLIGHQALFLQRKDKGGSLVPEPVWK